MFRRTNKPAHPWDVKGSATHRSVLPECVRHADKIVAYEPERFVHMDADGIKVADSAILSVKPGSVPGQIWVRTEVDKKSIDLGSFPGAPGDHGPCENWIKIGRDKTTGVKTLLLDERKIQTNYLNYNA